MQGAKRLGKKASGAGTTSSTDRLVCMGQLGNKDDTPNLKTNNSLVTAMNDLGWVFHKALSLCRDKDQQHHGCLKGAAGKNRIVLFSLTLELGNSGDGNGWICTGSFTRHSTCAMDKDLQ